MTSRETKDSGAPTVTQVRRVETYEPKRRTETENRMLIRAAVNKVSEDTAGRALRPAR